MKRDKAEVLAREAKRAREESHATNDSSNVLHDDLLDADSKNKSKSATKSYGRSINYLAESHLIEQYLDQKKSNTSFSSKFGQAANLLCKSTKGDEAVKVNQCPLVDVSTHLPPGATIDFSGVVNDLRSTSRKLSKLNAQSKPRRKRKTASKHDNFPTEFDRDRKHDFVFEPSSSLLPVFHPVKANTNLTCTERNFSEYVSSVLMTGTTDCDISYSNLSAINDLLSSGPTQSALHRCSYQEQELEWYDNVDINSIAITGMFDVLGTSNVSGVDGVDGFYEPELEINDQISDDDTVNHCNLSRLSPQLADPLSYRMYDVPRAQMDGGAKCSVTNNLLLLKHVRFYNKFFPCKTKMKGATSTSIIVPKAEGYLQVPTIVDGETIDIKCFYSPDFTSTLLSDNDVLLSNKYHKAYKGQSMVKFFEPDEIKELSSSQQAKQKRQLSDSVTSCYDHNYGNCILACTHKSKSNRNIYIPGIIRSGLCYTMPLVIPPGPRSNHPEASSLNSLEYAVKHDPTFKLKCDLKSYEAIYDYQQSQHLKLMQILESVPQKYHRLPFHHWIARNTPVHALTNKAHEVLWHQRLIHLSPQTLKDAYKHVDGIPNLSKFEFDDIDNCSTCSKANMRKRSPGKRSLSDSVTRPYQGLFIDFGFSGRISFDKDGKVIESSRQDIEGLNGETAWILIADAQTKMLHGDTRVSKASPLKYLESFLQEYSPNVPNKFVVLDQGGELYRNPAILNLFRRYKYRVYPTGADASFQNGPVERAHRTVATSIRALLFGADLPIKFWSYAFHHVLRIRNALPHRNQPSSPIFLSTGKKDNFTKLRTFGCRVHVRPPGVRSKRFKSEARQGIFLGYVPHTDRLILWYDEGSGRVKIATHAKFDEGFNDLPAEVLPPNCQHVRRLNGDRVPAETAEIGASDLQFFVYPFSDKQTATIPVLAKGTDPLFGFKLRDDDLLGRSYVEDLLDTKTSSAAKSFGTCKRSRRHLRGVFITHINGLPVFSTAQATAKLKLIYEQLMIAQKDGVSDKFDFEITYSREANLQGKKLKGAIDDYNCLAPGTTKRTKSAINDDDDGDEVSLEDDDRTARLPIGFTISKVFDGVKFKGKVIGYDHKSRFYQIEYSDGDQEELFHNEVHRYGSVVKKVAKAVSKSSRLKNNGAKSKSKSSTVPSAKSKPKAKSNSSNVPTPQPRLQKRKDIRRKHKTRSFHRRMGWKMALATTQALLISHNMSIAKMAPSEVHFEDGKEYELSIDDIRAITKLKNNHRDLDMSEESISNDMMKVIINTLGSDSITPEEQALGFYTRKKLKKLSTWDEWLAGETKQINQFTHQGMFGDPVDRATLPKDAIILRPHWNYLVKRNGIRRSRMCCNGSKKAAPQLHAVASTWSSCVELPVQRMFMAIAAHLNLPIYGADCIDAYAHADAPSDTYLTIDEAYSDWYEKKFGRRIDRRQVLPVHHALQGHPESGKMWMLLIDKVLIKDFGFHTTTHDRCIYRRVVDGKVQLLLRQVDDIIMAIDSESTAKELCNSIGMKIRFPTEVKDNKVPMEFLGLVSDYNGVGITQTRWYIEMNCANYIRRFLKSHGWDTNSPGTDPPVVAPIAVPPDAIPCDEDAAAAAALEVHEMTSTIPPAALFESLPSSFSPPKACTPTVPIDSDTKINTDPTVKSSREFPDCMKSSKPIAPLPTDCIEQIYKEKGPMENTVEHSALEKMKGFAYRTVLGELMYAYITCRPDIGYAVTTLSKFSTSPSAYHYKLLKGVAKYLRSTISWGIRFHRKEALIYEGLQAVECYTIPDDNGFGEQCNINQMKLIGFVDAAYANDHRKRRSTTGLAFTLCGGAIVYKSKTQSLTAVSSTEAEFIAAFDAGKICRYLRMILKQLGYEQKEATIINIDNQAALQIINDNTSPTERTRHIDVRYWAIQDWIQDKSIFMQWIPGPLNISDAETKPLGYVLHARHCRRMMGHYTPLQITGIT